MRAALIALVPAVAIGVIAGSIDRFLLAYAPAAETTWGIPLLALLAVLAPIPASALLRSFGGIAGMGALALAVELAVDVVVRGCGSDCGNAVVATLVWPLIYLYVFFTLPASLIAWLVTRRRGVRRRSL